MKREILSILLSTCLALTLLPMAALATDNPDGRDAAASYESGNADYTSGSSKTYASTPGNGYAVADALVDALVDGKSAGAVTSNAFSKATAAHTISAAFAKISYADVQPSDWYYDGVEYVTEHGLMSGTGSGVFSPSRALTRGMIVTILWRMAGSPAMDDYGYPYADVQADTNVFAPGVYWARNSGIVKGYSDEKFGPNDPVTRAQFSAILYRCAKFTGVDVTQGGMAIREFDDYASIPSYAGEAMAWCVNTGLLTGSANRLMPQGTATRAQAAVILTRYLSK